MAYTVREMTDSAAFERLVAFQENSAHEVCHRRDHAGFVADAYRSGSHDEARRKQRKPPPLMS